MKGIWTDGVLYAGVAASGYLTGFFSSDDAAKYVDPMLLFWIKGSIGTVTAVLLAAKMYRSTAFADNKQKQAEANK
jgi:hypothetical protein